MSTFTVAVTTGTQYQTGATGSIYTFDGSQPASFTFPWVEDGVLRLEQSGSSNDGHPLIFSTSNSPLLSTMRAGIISSGVTYYLDGSSNQSDYTNTTTFNAATTRYRNSSYFRNRFLFCMLGPWYWNGWNYGHHSDLMGSFKLG